MTTWYRQRQSCEDEVEQKSTAETEADQALDQRLWQLYTTEIDSAGEEAFFQARRERFRQEIAGKKLHPGVTKSGERTKYGRSRRKIKFFSPKSG